MDISDLLSFTQSLVQIQSFSGQEAAATRRVADEMRRVSFDRVWIDEWGNCIGIIEGAQPGKTLLFDAHTDTVGISPGVPWRDDPFCGRIEEDTIYGRGSADMKGALAAMIHAAASLDRTKLQGRVVVSASTLEEVLEGAALQKVIAQVAPDYVVIGEPSALNIARGGRGRAEIHLKTIGKPAHSSSPQLGRNAVLDMMQVLVTIERLPIAEDPLFGPAIFALTDIISEPYPGNSVVPTVCKVTYDRRLLPGESVESVLQVLDHLPGCGDLQLEATIGEGVYTTYTGKTLSASKFFPAWVLPESDDFVQRSLSALQQTGLQPQTRAYHFCTNAAYTAGVAGIPTIGFGPAEEGDAHVINERLKIEELVAVAKGYQAIIESTLGA